MSTDQDETHQSPRPSADSSARAQQILQAADELLAERGHDAVSMRDVAQRAGVNKALIFYYFGSRAQLFDRVLERYYHNHDAALAAAVLSGGRARDRVHTALDAYLDFIEDNALFSRLAQQELARQDPQLEQVRASLAKLEVAIADALEGVLPGAGPLSSRQFFLTVGALAIHHGTWTSGLTESWDDPDAADATRADRRAHLHWLADAVVDRLERDRARRALA